MTDDKPQPTEPTPTYSDRGFAAMAPIKGGYADEMGEVQLTGDTIMVYESSAASAPHIWVSISEREPLERRLYRLPDDVGNRAAVHLPLHEAEQLRDALTYLIEHHYQRGVGQ